MAGVEKPQAQRVTYVEKSVQPKRFIRTDFRPLSVFDFVTFILIIWFLLIANFKK